MLKWLKKLGCIIVAIGVIAVSVNMFLAPHSIAAGGITGLAIIFESLLGFERYITILVANVAILLSALIFLGKEVFLNTLIGAALLPVFIRFVPEINLVDNTMLAMVAGSALFGVAVAILYANRASSGGTSVPPLIFKKYFRLNTSIGLFISDGIIIALNLVVFTVDSFFYAIFSVLITAITMGYIESGINKKKMVYIISDENELIKNDILKKINRGVTLVPVIGAYANTERQMLMVTLDSRNYRDLLSLIKEHDEYAFMVTNTVTDVYGQGFTYESGTV
jgi:uncharacterized membrane-anchored protein YitT (DUF2179 family)